MKFSFILLLAAFGLACASCPSPDDIVDLYEPTVSASSSVNTTPYPFFVNFEIVVFRDQITQYPDIWAGCEHALQEWSTYVPVRWVIFKEEPDKILSMRGRTRIIELHLDDLQGPGYGLPDGMIGLWRPHIRHIVLDADFLAGRKDKSYSVMLHEVGHMFGLPHIINFSEMGHTGTLVTTILDDATRYVMYPNAMPGRDQKFLSDFEIDIARHNVIYRWTVSYDETFKEEDCELYLK